MSQSRPSENLRRKPKIKESVITLSVTLKDLYKGTKKNLKFMRKTVCVACKGRGGKEGTERECKYCKGTGCEKCNEMGHDFSHKNKCGKCIRKRTLHEQEAVIRVVIVPGMRDGQRILIKSEGDEQIGTAESGDVIVVLKVDQHEQFKRRGDDLITKQTRTISMQEAICGYSMKITHLDGRTVVFKTEDGIIVKNGLWQKIIGEGMPIEGSENRGNLYILFDIVYSSQSFGSKEACKKIEGLLGGRPIQRFPVIGGNVQNVSLMQFDPRFHGTDGDPFKESVNRVKKSGVYERLLRKYEDKPSYYDGYYRQSQECSMM